MRGGLIIIHSDAALRVGLIIIQSDAALRVGLIIIHSDAAVRVGLVIIHSDIALSDRIAIPSEMLRDLRFRRHTPFRQLAKTKCRWCFDNYKTHKAADKQAVSESAKTVPMVPKGWNNHRNSGWGPRCVISGELGG